MNYLIIFTSGRQMIVECDDFISNAQGVSFTKKGESLFAMFVTFSSIEYIIDLNSGLAKEKKIRRV